ncbi:MAG: aspartyl protease family protein [Candidatus Bathyarchaeia archaeon]
MGYVYVKALLGDPGRARTREVRFLADTGAGYMVLRPELARELGLIPVGKTKALVADNRVVEADVAPAYIKVLDREAVVLAAIMDSPESLLGAFTLEVLGLSVDPSTGKVEPTRAFTMML